MTYVPPDVTATPRLVWVNRFRIGDAVTAFTLMHLIQERRVMLGFDPAIMHAQDGAYLNALSREIGMVNPVDIQPPTPTAAPPEEATVVDDIMLWHWNYLFRKAGIRLPVRERSPGPWVIFAPLPEADYSAERAMHMMFVEEMIARLDRRYGADLRVMIPHNPPGVTRELLTRICATIGAQTIEGTRKEMIERVATCRAFIGGDTGFSHVAGLYEWVRQVALHDRMNTATHNEREFDHQRFNRERVLAFAESLGIVADWSEYYSFPNKPSATCRRVEFDRGGADGITADEVEASLTYMGL